MYSFLNFALSSASLSQNISLISESGSFQERIALKDDVVIDGRAYSSYASVVFSKDGNHIWTNDAYSNYINKTRISDSSSSFSYYLASVNPFCIHRSGSSVFTMTYSGGKIFEFDDSTNTFIQSASSPVVSPHYMMKPKDKVWINVWGAGQPQEYTWPELSGTRSCPLSSVSNMSCGIIDGVEVLLFTNSSNGKIAIYRESDLALIATLDRISGSYPGSPGFFTYAWADHCVGPVDGKVYCSDQYTQTQPGQGALDRFLSGSVFDKRVIWPSSDIGGFPIGMIYHRPLFSFSDDQTKIAYIQHKTTNDDSRVIVRDISVASASWSRSFESNVNVIRFIAQGEFANERDVNNDYRKTKFYYSIGSSSLEEFTPNKELSISLSSGSILNVSVKFCDWELPAGPKPYLTSLEAILSSSL